MALAEENLTTAASLLKKGVAPQRETVRAFLLWFDAERRGDRVIRRIRSALKRHGLATSPDFQFAWLDGALTFHEAPPDAGNGVMANGVAASDPTYRIGRLDAANKPPIVVGPDATLQQAVTIMLTNDFSQLPVMTNPRDVRGIISWKAIGSRLALKRPCGFVRDCIEPAQIVSNDESLFAGISLIASHDYVLVRAIDRTISGIVTASDFNIQFRTLAEPFLLVGEIENGVRRILHGKFTIRELEEAKAPGDDERKIESPADLTLGEYVRLVESDNRWKKLKIEIDRAEFVARLNRVREIRNDVMHFDPDGLDPEDLRFLQEFAQFLKRLRDVGAV